MVHGFPEKYDEGIETKLKESIILHPPSRRRKKEKIFRSRTNIKLFANDPHVLYFDPQNKVYYDIGRNDQWGSNSYNNW